MTPHRYAHLVYNMRANTHTSTRTRARSATSTAFAAATSDPAVISSIVIRTCLLTRYTTNATVTHIPITQVPSTSAGSSASAPSSPAPAAASTAQTPGRQQRFSSFFGRLTRTASTSGRDEIFKAPAVAVPRTAEDDAAAAAAAAKEKEGQPQEFSDAAYPPLVRRADGYAVEGHKVYTGPYDLSLHEQDLQLPVRSLIHHISQPFVAPTPTGRYTTTLLLLIANSILHTYA